jgi:hypothetical protein
LRLRSQHALVEDKNLLINVGRLVGAGLASASSILADQDADPRSKALAKNLWLSAQWFIDEQERIPDLWEELPKISK